MNNTYKIKEIKIKERTAYEVVYGENDKYSFNKTFKTYKSAEKAIKEYIKLHQ